MAAGKKKVSAASRAAAANAAAKKRTGDWRGSNIAQKTLISLQKEGQISQAPGSFRKPPRDEEFPNPQGLERVVFADHFPRGLSFPLHPFFLALLHIYGIQLHDLPPNAIQHISCFIVLCECFLGIHPHWGLWKRIFRVKFHMEPPVAGERERVPMNTGAFGIQVGKNVIYFDMKFLASVQNWRRRWFYLKGKNSDDLPEFNPHSLLSRRKSWNHELTQEELEETEPLMNQIAELRKVSSGPWINGLHLSCVFVMRRIQPLMVRDHPMWEYTGAEDTTRTKSSELSTDEFNTRIRAITHIDRDDSPTLAHLPFSSDNPPKKVTFACLGCPFLFLE